MEPTASEVVSLRRDLERLWSMIGWPPGHYYSPIPDLDEIRQREDTIFPDPPLRHGPAGIDLNEAGQLALLLRLAPFVPFVPWRDDAASMRYCQPNTFFSLSDATLLAAMLQLVRPRRLIEIGSGYSSAAALDVDEHLLGRRTAFTFVEPYPERLETLLRPEDRAHVTILKEKLQDVDLALFDGLESGDVLFVDSSHVAKVGSDVNRVFFDILPRLKPGVIVHVHDIFYPFEYPKAWVYEGRFWNECYLLRAFLTHNDAYDVLLFSDFLSKCRPDEFARVVPTHVASGGGSFWMRKTR